MLATHLLLALKMGVGGQYVYLHPVSVGSHVGHTSASSAEDGCGRTVHVPPPSTCRHVKGQPLTLLMT